MLVVRKSRYDGLPSDHNTTAAAQEKGVLGSSNRLVVVLELRASTPRAARSSYCVVRRSTAAKLANIVVTICFQPTCILVKINTPKTHFKNIKFAIIKNSARRQSVTLYKTPVKYLFPACWVTTVCVRVCFS